MSAFGTVCLWLVSLRSAVDGKCGSTGRRRADAKDVPQSKILHTDYLALRAYINSELAHGSCI